MIVVFHAISYLTTEHIFEILGGQLPGCPPHGFRVCSQDFSASLRNKSCKRWDLVQSDQQNFACLCYFFHGERSSCNKPDNGTSRPVC